MVGYGGACYGLEVIGYGQRVPGRLCSPILIELRGAIMVHIPQRRSSALATVGKPFAHDCTTTVA